MRRLAGLMMFLAAGAACAAPGAGGRGPAQDAAVVFWTSGYDGAELAGKQCPCPLPQLPAIAHAGPHLRGVRAAIASWDRCHRAYIAGLRAAPADARIPPAVLAAMTPGERARARAHVQAVQAKVAEAAQADAEAAMARHATWLGAQVEYLAQHGSVADRRGTVASGRREQDGSRHPGR